MNYLYIDSSQDLEFGLYDPNQRKWIGYKRVEGEQNSKVLHFQLYHLLKELNLKLSAIDALVINSGPGSYTGMRLTEGLAQILEWQKIVVYSFYHYQVPAILGEKKYFWISTAFKGEWFIYSNIDNNKKLIREAELSDFILNLKPLYTHYDVKKLGLIETSKMIKEKFYQLITYLIKNSSREDVYYFREAEVEFKTVAYNQQRLNE